MATRKQWIILLVLGVISVAHAKQVSCVGDSITYGSGIANRNTDSYPAQLEDLLCQVNSTWQVMNFGVSGATLLHRGDRPYIQESAYQRALESQPDIVIIKLGTNDSKSRNWVYANDFVSDYCQLIDAFRALPSHPQVWICKPVPAFALTYSISPTIIHDEILPMIEEIATLTNAPIIDLYTALLDYGHLFPDMIHPNAAGAAIIAQTIAPLLLGVIQPADFNADGLVNMIDLAYLADAWKLPSETFDLGPVPTGDGIINEQDLKGLSQVWLTYPGLIGHWRLDEIEGDIAKNEVGDVKGMLHGGPQWQPEGGVLSGAIELDGIDDYISISSVLDPSTGPFTVLAWIQGGGPDQVITCQGNSIQNTTTLLGTDESGALMTAITDGGRVTRPLISTTIITDGVWHFIRLVWDGTCRSLYVDDQLIAQDTHELENLKPSTAPWLLGTSGDKNAESFWFGLIDDVRIYNQALVVRE